MPGRPAADLVLRNGKIATLDARATVAEALAARDGRIVAVGRDDDVAPRAGPGTEVVKGSLEPGKLADVAVLDRDVLAVPADLIREPRVDLTIVGGVVRFRR
jgi:predicted amidohydrolase YtcJ